VPHPVTTAVKPAYFVLQIVNLPVPWFVLLQVKCRNCKTNIAFLKFILGELISKPPTQRVESEIFQWSWRLLVVSSQQVAYSFISWGRWVQFWQVHSVRLRYILISFRPHLGLKWCFPFTFFDYILCIFLRFLCDATCLSHLVLLALVTQIIGLFGELYDVRNSFYSFLQSSVTYARSKCCL
jgi:hypothetical protein